MFFGFFGNFSSKKKKKLQVSAVARQVEISPSTIFRIMKNIKYPKPSALPKSYDFMESKKSCANEFNDVTPKS